MKILEINTFNKVVGGVESYVAAMARALVDRGHTLVPLYLMPEEDHPGLVPGHRGYYMHDLTPHHTDQIMESFRSGRAEEVRKRFREILEAEKPDLIHCNNIYSPVLLREVFGRIPTIRTVHDYRFLCPRLLKLTVRSERLCDQPMGLACFKERCVSPFSHAGLRHMMLLRWELEVSKDFDHIVTKSEHMKRQLVRAGIPADQIEAIPLSVVPPDLPPEPAVADGHKPVLLFPGRVAPEKGVEILLRALSRIDTPYTLQIAGDGPSMHDCRKLAGELGMEQHVQFLGWKGVDELAQLYQGCDIVVVPSIWPEPFGLVGLEAMSHARAVVAFDVGGIPEWLDHEHSGLLVEVGDEEGLTQALERLLYDAELRLQLGLNGRREVEGRFTMDIAAGKLLRLFENHLKL